MALLIVRGFCLDALMSIFCLYRLVKKQRNPDDIFMHDRQTLTLFSLLFLSLFIYQGKTVRLTVAPTWSVLYLKHRIQLLYGYPFMDVRLLWGKKPLYDQELLSQIGIGRDATLRVILRIIGGCNCTVCGCPYTLAAVIANSKLIVRRT